MFVPPQSFLRATVLCSRMPLLPRFPPFLHLPLPPRLPTLWNPSRRSNCVCMSIRGWKRGPKSTQPALVTWAKRCSGDLPQWPPGGKSKRCKGKGGQEWRREITVTMTRIKASNGARQTPFTHWTFTATLQMCSNAAQLFWFFHFAPRGYVFKNLLLVTWLQSLKIDIKSHINLMVYKVPKVYIPFLGFHFYNVLEMPKL